MKEHQKLLTVVEENRKTDLVSQWVSLRIILFSFWMFLDGNDGTELFLVLKTTH